MQTNGYKTMAKKIPLTIKLCLVLIIDLSGQDLPRKGSFGAVIANLSQTDVSAWRLPNNNGVVVKRVFPGSGADLAGLAKNDVLVTLDSGGITNTPHFLELLSSYSGGDQLTVGLFRDSRRISLKVTLQPKPKESSSEFEVIYSSVRSGENLLRTIVTKPKGEARYPGVLIIGGVGCYSIDNPTHKRIMSNKMWIDSLTRNGFVTMRVEKTGMGDSRGLPCDQSDFLTEKKGFHNGLLKLKSLSFVDEDQIYLVGFSMGGVIAPMIHAEEQVKGIIVYGTIGAKWIDYERENTRRQRLLEGYGGAALKKWMSAEEIRLRGLFEEKKSQEQIILDNPKTKSVFFDYPMDIKYFQQVADIDILDLWNKSNVKVLAIHGSSDFVSSAKEHQKIAEMVNVSNPSNGTYIEIENADHWGLYTMNQKASKQGSSMELNREVVSKALDWLKKQ